MVPQPEKYGSCLSRLCDAAASTQSSWRRETGDARCRAHSRSEFEYLEKDLQDQRSMPLSSGSGESEYARGSPEARSIGRS